MKRYFRNLFYSWIFKNIVTDKDFYTFMSYITISFLDDEVLIYMADNFKPTK